MFFVLSEGNKKDINDIIGKHKCVCLYHWNMCGYCQALMPTWNRLCKKYMNDKNVIIINIELNEKPLLKANYRKDINGFPTIIKYDKGKRIDEFNNKREFKELNDFVKS